MEAIASATASKTADSPMQDKACRAGAQFEAVLLNNVLGGVERAFTELPGGHKEHSTEVYSGLAMQALTSALADQGGIGLGKLIAGALIQRSGEDAEK
jgi:Rod binding domain-containing protein